jgi:hypothetical protein
MKYTIENGVVTFEKPIKVNKNYSIDSFDLNKLSDLQLLKSGKINGIQLDTNFNLMEIKDNNALRLDYDINYVNDELQITGGVSSCTGASIISVQEAVNTDLLIQKAIDLLKDDPKSVNLSNIDAFDESTKLIKNKINESAFENGILLAGEELNYRINLYDRNDSLIGLANRAYINESYITLCEVMLFDTKTNINSINIEIVLNKNSAIKIIDLEHNASSGESIRYCRYATSRAKIKLEEGTYEDSKMKLKNLQLPEFDPSVMVLNTALTEQNDINALTKAYKQNKKMNIVKIDINKYLLG